MNNDKYLDPRTVQSVLFKIGHRIYTVRFEKKNGDVRVLNGRNGVKKHLAGGARTSPEWCQIVFDLQKKEYRSFDKSKVLELRALGRTFDMVYQRNEI